MNSGPIGLVGGLEHRPGREPIDRGLMEAVGVGIPNVVVLPSASSRGQQPLAAALARNYWSRLGGRVSVASTNPAHFDRAVALTGEADIIVLPGGHPNKLVADLAPSPLLDVIIERWARGAGVTGSSAGAMALFEWRLRLYPPNPLEPIPGLGLLDGYVAAPHFDRFRALRWAPRLTHRLGGLGVIGLDESTGLVGTLSDLRVIGPGTVTVVEGGATAVYSQGERLAVDLVAGSGVRPSPQPRLHHVQSSGVESSADSGPGHATSRLLVGAGGSTQRFSSAHQATAPCYS